MYCVISLFESLKKSFYIMIKVLRIKYNGKYIKRLLRISSCILKRYI
jgi:hypothetical protein